MIGIRPESQLLFMQLAKDFLQILWPSSLAWPTFHMVSDSLNLYKKMIQKTTCMCFSDHEFFDCWCGHVGFFAISVQLSRILFALI